MADKGIRMYVDRKFMELLPTRVNDRAGNTLFRKNVMHAAMEAFGITISSAATHYNHSFQKCKKATPALVEGLGRADDKKGGRKAKVVPELVGPIAPTETAPTETAPTETAPTGETVASDENNASETAPEQTVFTVKKKGDNSVVAENLSFEDATALVAKAAAAKKAKLYFV